MSPTSLDWSILMASVFFSDMASAGPSSFQTAVTLQLPTPTLIRKPVTVQSLRSYLQQPTLHRPNCSEIANFKRGRDRVKYTKQSVAADKTMLRHHGHSLRRAFNSVRMCELKRHPQRVRWPAIKVFTSTICASTLNDDTGKRADVKDLQKKSESIIYIPRRRVSIFTQTYICKTGTICMSRDDQRSPFELRSVWKICILKLG